MRDPIRDQIVVITGSTRGFGHAAAVALTRAGAWVVVNGRDAGAVRRVVAQLRRGGGRVHGVVADVSQPAGAHRLLEGALAAWGGIDIWINNAGVGGPLPAPLWREPAAAQCAVLRTNLEGPLLCASELCRWAVAQCVRPWLVNISSGAGERASAGAAAYIASKHGLEGLTKALAADAQETGVTVTALKLPALRTAMTRRRMSAAEHARLPPPQAAVPALLELLRADRSAVHGRSFAAWRMLGAAAAELGLNQPLVDAGAYGIWWQRRKSLDAGPAALRLDRLESPFCPSPAALAALAAHAEGDGGNRYPDEHQTALRAALSARSGCFPTDLSLGPGATELVERMLRLFVHPGEAVVCHDPTWFLFDRLCTAAGVEVRRVPIRIDLDRGAVDLGIQPILDQVRAGARLIYLVNPGNPLGVAWPRDQLADLVRSIPPSVPLVVDEAYAEFASGDDLLLSPELLGRGRDRTLIALRTLSKFYGLAGLRVGYAMASSTPLAVLLSTLETPYNVATASAAAATAALADSAHAERVRTGVLREKRRWYERLRGRGWRFLPSETCFIYVELPRAADAFLDRMEARSIFLPRAVFDRRCIVVPIAQPAQNDRVWKAMGAVLAQRWR
ncbi:MAG: aminotransferase class I/II-fold pyridoxal phosphate-dependent enzyme [Deltaproteobacteria bacterium]|nr:aminotransferase class I/II-fold pyridoxal phosphate-dependent enzyme [Deltaproteobacteria bacterium]